MYHSVITIVGRGEEGTQVLQLACMYSMMVGVVKQLFYASGCGQAIILWW